MALRNDAMRMLQVRYPTYAAKWNELRAIPGLEAEFARGFSLVSEASYASDDDTSARTIGSTGVAIMDKALNDASTDPVKFVKSNLLESMVIGNSDLATNQVKYLKQNNVPINDISNLWQENIAKIEQGQRRSKEGITPGQLTALGLAVILPGAGSAIGGQLLAAGLLPVGTTVATATAVGTSLASAAAQVAQGKSADEVLKGAVVGGATGYVGAKVGDYLVGDPGTVKNLVTNTAANIVAGKNPEDAVKAGIASTGAGLAGSTVAGATGSAFAGQLAAGTTAGLLTGKTAEQSLAQGVGNVKLDSLIPDTGVTVANEAQVTAGQQDLMNQLAPFEVDTTAGLRNIVDYPVYAKQKGFEPTDEKDIDAKIVQKDEPVTKPDEKVETNEPTIGDVPNKSGTDLQKAVDLGKSGDMLGQINMMREIVGMPAFKSMDEYNAYQNSQNREEKVEPTKDEALPPKTEPGLPSVLPAEPETKTTLYTKEDEERDQQAEQARRVADFGKDLTGGGNQDLGDVDTKTGFYDPDASGLGAYKYDAQSGTYTFTSDDGSTLTVDGEGKIVGNTPATDSKPPAVEATKPPATKTPQTKPPAVTPPKQPDTGLPSIVPAVIGAGVVGAVVGSNTGTTPPPAVPAAGSNVTLNWNQQEIKKPENGIAYGQKFFDPVFSAAGGGLMALAAGGMAGKFTTLGSYSDGGRLLRGPGDGMSDNIPATIANRQPARLADGEFVVPADVVSHLGNGSTDAGAKVLYAMMDRVRKARTGKAKQGKKIMPQKFVPN